MQRRFAVAGVVVVMVAGSLLLATARSGAATTGLSSHAANPLTPPKLGWLVSLSADGTTALVGAPGVDRTYGAAYVFHVSSAGSWESSGAPIATLTNTTGWGRASFQQFGDGVALSADGTTAFVAAPSAGGSVRRGVVYVFHVPSEDAWASTSTPTASLSVSDGFIGAPFDVSSLAVSSDGTTLVAGAPTSTGSGGGAYIFHAPSEDAWASTSTPTATLTNDGESYKDREAGLTVAISGDGKTALLSDTADDFAGGHAWLYHVSSEDAWSSSAEPTAILGVGKYSALWGGGLALSGDGSVAFVWDPKDTGTGVVKVFHASSADAWVSTSTPAAVLAAPGNPEGVLFGESVTVSADGTTALVGAPWLDTRLGGTHVFGGVAFVFRASSEGAWASSSSPAATLASSGSGKSDDLGNGTALSADGATALLGAPGAHHSAGAADVFHVSDASSWAPTASPAAILDDPALDQCVVPSLERMTVPAARSALEAAGCRLGTVSKVHLVGVKRGRVVSQRRWPRTRWPVGTKVDVKVEK